MLLNRPSSRSEKAEADLKAFAREKKSKSNIETIPCDLQDFGSVKKAAKAIMSNKKYQAIDVFCANAGVMALEDKATKDGYDVQIQTNHLSHFMLIKDLIPCLKKAKELRGSARVAIHSSSARKALSGMGKLEAKYFEKNGGNLGGNGSSMFFGGARWVRYHQSKLANAVLTQALNDHLEGSGITAMVADPGLANTNLQTTTASDGGMGSGMWIMRFSQSAEDGSMPIVSACFKEETVRGKIWVPSKNGGIKGPPTLQPLEDVCMDKESREMLWEKSEQACGAFVV